MEENKIGHLERRQVIIMSPCSYCGMFADLEITADLSMVICSPHINGQHCWDCALSTLSNYYNTSRMLNARSPMLPQGMLLMSAVWRYLNSSVWQPKRLSLIHPPVVQGNNGWEPTSIEKWCKFGFLGRLLLGGFGTLSREHQIRRKGAICY